MSVITIISEGADGKAYASSFDTSKPIALAEIAEPEPIGPFLVQLTVGTADEKKSKEYQMSMLAAVTDSELHVMAKTFPVFAKVGLGFNLTNKLIGKIREVTVEDTIHATLLLNATNFQHGDFFYIKFSENSHQHITTVWSDKTNSMWNVPFYNFHTNGESCLGDTKITRDMDKWAKLVHFISGYTTPHITYSNRNTNDKHLNVQLETKGLATMADLERELEKPREVKWVSGTSETFCAQTEIGCITPPKCLATPEARKKVIGKLTPMKQGP